MWKSMGGNLFIQVEKVFLTGSDQYDLATKVISLYLKQSAFVHLGFNRFAYSTCFFSYSWSFLSTLAQWLETTLWFYIQN